MKKTLTFVLWPEPGRPIEGYPRPAYRQLVVALASRILRLKHLELVRRQSVPMLYREEGQVWPVYADTMIGIHRLDSLQACVETAIREEVPGDLLEAGVWRGGACIFMRAVLAAHGIRDRKVWVADSFQGLPKPDVRRYPADGHDRHYTQPFLAVGRDAVEENFRKYGLLDDQVVFLEGWFKDSLPNAAVHQLAVLRLDGDMYGSTTEALTHLYPLLAPGGFCIVDDYSLEGCRRAVDDYRAAKGIDGEMNAVDWSCRWWRKA